MQQPNPSTSVQNPTDRSTGNDPFCFAPFYAAGLKKNGGRLQDNPRAAFYFPSTMADDPPSVFFFVDPAASALPILCINCIARPYIYNHHKSLHALNQMSIRVRYKS
jgi:hypothetical protein